MTAAVTFTVVAAVFGLSAMIAAVPAVPVSVSRLIFRYIDVVIPSILHEIDGPATGIVLMTMLTPVLCVSRRNMHIDWGRYVYSCRYVGDDYGLWIDDCWRREGSDIDPAIETRLTNTNRDADIGGFC